MDTVEIIALGMGVAWASGINLYATIFMLGYLGGAGYIELPPDLQIILTSPLVIAAAGFMYMVEFFADKTPGVDTVWDTLHTFIRIPAGAVLAAGAVAEVSPEAALAALIIGGGLAAGSHLTKAGSRILINTSPEPVTNWAASLGEDVLVIAGLWVALQHPWLFLILLAVFLVIIAWLLPRIWRAIRQLFARIRAWFRRAAPDTGAGPSHGG